MNSPSLLPFSHRFRKSGVESICTSCFRTIAEVRRETDLERFECEHVCDPVMMKSFERVSQIASSLRRRRSVVCYGGAASIDT